MPLVLDVCTHYSVVLNSNVPSISAALCDLARKPEATGDKIKKKNVCLFDY